MTAAESAGLVDALDRKILAALNEDARKSTREIAEAIGASTGTVYNRLKKLTERGVIRGYIPLLDHQKTGYVFTILILIQVEGEYITDVEERLAATKEVMAVYDITGDFDVALIAKFQTQAALNAFIKSLLKTPHIRRTVTSMVLNVVKEDPRLQM
jgi:Lrp/AsnC family transcriptional regulator for asnA, asnC and gidA